MKKYIPTSHSHKPHESYPESVTFYFKTREEMKEFEDSLD